MLKDYNLDCEWVIAKEEELNMETVSINWSTMENSMNQQY